MLKNEQQRVFLETCASIIESGNLKELKPYISDLVRHKSWIGSEGLSPLHLAARYNQVEICHFLLEQGITSDITDPLTYKTPLHVAAYYGHLEVAKVLKKFRAQLDVNDCLSVKPIHYAAMGQKKELILFFLENKVNPASQSLFGNILDILIRKKNTKLVDFFSNIGGVASLDINYYPYSTPTRWAEKEWTPLHSAVVSGQDDIFEKSLEDLN